MMPPKKPAADSAALPTTSSKSPAEEAAGKDRADSVELRKLAAHPSTAIMVHEALEALDSRKGVTSQAIQKFIKLKYLSVDAVRLKHLVRRALKKGLETGTLVRPVNSSVTTGALGRFRLAPKVKEPKPKSENTDPNVQKPPKAKDGDKRPQKAGTKKKNSANGAVKSTETVKPPKNSKKDEAAAPSKVAPAKKPKAKRAEATGGEGSSNSTKTKTTKTKGPKTVKVSENRAAQAGGDAPAPKAAAKRAKKTA